MECRNRHKVPIPDTFEFARVVFYCTHGCFSWPRGEGVHDHAQIRFTGCEARTTAAVRKVQVEDKNGKLVYAWRIVVTSEATTHSHSITPAIFAQYALSSKIGDEQLFGAFDIMEAMRRKPAQMASLATHVIGRRVSPQQIRNLIAGRFGGTNAEDRMKRLIEDFLKIEGNRVAFVVDEHNITVGVIMQSKLQAEAFAMWPETVVMDWTYNTNNLGLHMGAMMVTSSTGRGLPVFEEFSASESKPALTTILEYFKTTNEAWTKIEAFVIDKDLPEWGVLEKLFHGVMVFLCQFHVAQAVGCALTGYSLSPKTQGVVADLFSNMMYSWTESVLAEHIAAFPTASTTGHLSESVIVAQSHWRYVPWRLS